MRRPENKPDTFSFGMSDRFPRKQPLAIHRKPLIEVSPDPMSLESLLDSRAIKSRRKWFHKWRKEEWLMLRSSQTLILFVSIGILSGCATPPVIKPPPEHWYDGPERPVHELALFTSWWMVDPPGWVVPYMIDGRRRVDRMGAKLTCSGDACRYDGHHEQYLLPGEHVVTFRWELNRLLKKVQQVDVEVTFEAGKTYESRVAVIDTSGFGGLSVSSRVFIWLVDNEENVVAGYRPRYLADGPRVELPRLRIEYVGDEIYYEELSHGYYYKVGLLDPQHKSRYDK